MKKLYSPDQIAIGLLLGGPLAAGYFMYNNYKILNKDKEADKSLIIAAIFWFLLFLAFEFVSFWLKVFFIIEVYIFFPVAGYKLFSFFSGEIMHKKLKSEYGSGSYIKVILLSLLIAFLTWLSFAFLHILLFFLGIIAWIK